MIGMIPGTLWEMVLITAAPFAFFSIRTGPVCGHLLRSAIVAAVCSGYPIRSRT